jgi:hypothetical protein
MKLALRRKRRLRDKYLERSEVRRAAELEDEIAALEEELRYEQELFDLEYS